MKTATNSVQYQHLKTSKLSENENSNKFCTVSTFERKHLSCSKNTNSNKVSTVSTFENI